MGLDWPVGQLVDKVSTSRTYTTIKATSPSRSSSERGAWAQHVIDLNYLERMYVRTCCQLPLYPFLLLIGAYWQDVSSAVRTVRNVRLLPKRNETAIERLAIIQFHRLQNNYGPARPKRRSSELNQSTDQQQQKNPSYYDFLLVPPTTFIKIYWAEG